MLLARLFLYIGIIKKNTDLALPLPLFKLSQCGNVIFIFVNCQHYILFIQLEVYIYEKKSNKEKE